MNLEHHESPTSSRTTGAGSVSPSRSQFWGSILIAVPSLAALAMHAYLGSFSRYMADDYCSASYALRLGILRASWYWYRTWNGRYSANLLDAVSARLGVTFTPAVTALVIFLWLGALAWAAVLLATFGTNKRDARLALAAAAAVLFATLAVTPSVAQSLYWGQGMRSLVPPLILLTLYVAVILWSRTREFSSGQKSTSMAVSLLLTFVAGGFSETYTALQLSAVCLALFILVVARKRATEKNAMTLLSAGLIGAIVSFILVVISPGNAARQALSPPSPPLLILLIIAIRAYAHFLWQLVTSAPNVLCLAAIISVGLWVGSTGALSAFSPRAIPWIILVGAIITFSCFPPAAFGQSDAPPDRTLLIPTYLLVVSLLLLGVSLGDPLKTHLSLHPLLTGLGGITILIACAGSLQHMFSVQHTFQAYAQAWGQFDRELTAARRVGAASAAISTADMNANNWAELNVLGDNPKFWLNICVSDFYGVKVISNSP